MALVEFKLSCDHALRKMASCVALVPEKPKGPLPVLYLLHGLSDDHTAWTRFSNVERHVGNLPLIVVMPNGERSFYVDHKERPFLNFQRFITDDLIGFVDRRLRTVPTAKGRVVAGLSMGGYGAMRLALGRPDLFSAAVSHSGALVTGHYPFTGTDEWAKEMSAWFGKWPIGGEDDLFALAAKLSKKDRPALRIDCGKKDFLLDANRKFHKHLQSLKYPHEYAEHPGAHTWDYWDLHIRDTLTYFGRILKIRP